MAYEPIPDINDAIQLAAHAHAGQVDKLGQPYILHPLRVMQRTIVRYGPGWEAMAAVLHDVVEDTYITLEELSKRRYPITVIGLVARLSRDKGQDYKEYIKHIGKNEAARYIKIEDICDNLSRLPAVEDAQTKKRLRQKYVWALEYLGYWKTVHKGTSTIKTKRKKR